MSSSLNRTLVSFSVTNCICNDQRVLKMAETVSRLNCEITIIGRKRGDCCNKNSVPFKTIRFRMLFSRGFLFYKFFNIRLFFYLLLHKSDLLVSNDLDTLLPNFLVSKLKRLPLVYDSHEYFTGVPELQSRPFIKWIWESIERMIFPNLENVITVCDSIADQYNTEYGIRPVTVRNCSKKSDSIQPYSREELGINKDHLLIILQGTGINIDRGGEELIEAVRQTENISLLIAGTGDVIAELKLIVKTNSLNDRILFIPKMPWEEMMKYTKSVDTGVTLDKDSNMNYRFSLPNKLFDYLSAGIPVIASDLYEVNKIVTENDCGIIIPSVTPEDISSALKHLFSDREKLAELKRNALLTSQKLNWDIESEKVIEFYRKVLKYDIINPAVRE
jgi:glycosyltransferase involved in cell wall biosynthesis